MDKSSDIEIYSDGGSRGNPGPGASAFVVYKNGVVIYKHGYYLQRTTNNIAECFAVLMAFAWIHKNINELKLTDVVFKIDSELVVNQLKGSFKIKNIKLKNIYIKIDYYKSKLTDLKFVFHHIPRENNRVADALVNKTVDENL